MTSIVRQFYGQTAKDTYTVFDWVEKVDTEFTIQMGGRQSGRLDIVRSLLAGTALKWMNRKLLELNEAVARGETDVEVEWEALRQPFIDAHLGINTIETFKAQLRALRFGGRYNSTCPTPVELNKEFDHLAELAYPDRRSDMRDSVLGDEYGKIIAASNIELYRSVMLNQSPSRIDEWKKALSQRWAAQKNVEAIEAQLGGRREQPYEQPRGGGGGRGGWAGRGSFNKGQPSKPHTATVNTASTSDSGDGMEGEQWTAEGETDEKQLSAASSGGQRGGRGGRGRGRGGFVQRAPMTPERQKLYEAGQCFNCRETGHIAAQCPKPQQLNQGKEGANQ